MKLLLNGILLLMLAMGSLSVSAQSESDYGDYALVDSVAAESLPTVSRYFFAHQYLSVVAPQVTEDEVFMLMTPEFLNTLIPADYGFASPYSNEEISVEAVERDGKTIYVWQFPEPKHLRESLYIAFFPGEDGYKAVAISIGELVDWEVSVSNKNYRQTFGRIKRPESAVECVDLLIARGAMTPDIQGGDFIQEGYVAPDSDY